MSEMDSFLEMGHVEGGAFGSGKSFYLKTAGPGFEYFLFSLTPLWQFVSQQKLNNNS
jgi:hypothetical protein